MTQFLVLFALTFTSVNVFATPFPADGLIKFDTPSSGNFDGVKIIRGMQQSGAIAIEIEYRGKLSRGMPLAAYVRVHYLDGDRDGYFPMTYYQDSMGQAYWTVRLTNGCLVRGPMGGCDEFGSAKMKHVLFWATAPGRLNALNIEVAFVDAKDHWDSGTAGKNYPYLFGELSY